MIDCHAHLSSSSLDYKSIIENMQADKLDAIVTVSTSLEDCNSNMQIAQKFDNVFFTVGLHPEYASEQTIADVDKLSQFFASKKLVAIGEIGLDYHYNASEEQKELQKRLFTKQLELASKHNLPVVIHCRDAAQDVLQILKQFPELYGKICMHCYSEGEKYADSFSSLGCYFSFTGNVTYKHMDNNYIRRLDANKIMVETDSPYLSPVPLRGQTNVPKNVWLTAQTIADVLQTDINNFEKLTNQNARTFFNIK